MVTIQLLGLSKSLGYNFFNFIFFLKYVLNMKWKKEDGLKAQRSLIIAKTKLQVVGDRIS